MRKLALALALLLVFSGTSAVAETKKPTPKPKVKVTTKATVKPKATAKATVKPKPKPKPKPKKPRKKVRVTPSPKPKWPPVGFEQNGQVFAKVPTSKELVGVISSKKNLASQVADCETYVCGAVQIASESGCLWWEVNSKVVGIGNKPLGSLTTLSWTTLAREVKTILLISPESLFETQGRVTNISVICHQEAKPAGTPAVSYTKAE